LDLNGLLKPKNSFSPPEKEQYMTEASQLRYLTHTEIDVQKWNQCIDNANNCRIYAYNWQLDRAASRWDALILGDYDYVMPLPVKKKFGITYFYQPMFSQQLGIYPTSTKTISDLFYNWLHTHFRFAELNLNAGNLPGKGFEKIHFESRKNYLLPLGNDYATISSFFSKNTKRNIAKANKQNLSLIEGIRLETYLEFKRQNLPPNVPVKSMDTLKNMIAYGQYKGFGEIYGVYSSDNQLCAAVYFCRWKDRVIYFNAASSEKGKEQGGMHFLLNQFIQKNAGKNLTIDFEGSMIPGVARFYAGFGATPETYFHLKFNRLPLPLRWLKR